MQYSVFTKLIHFIFNIFIIFIFAKLNKIVYSFLTGV